MYQILPSYYCKFPYKSTYDTWEFDTITDCTTAGVPISTTTAYEGMTIDWGDGTVTSVTSVEDYVHTYTEAGQYHITVGYDDWANVGLIRSSAASDATSPIQEARDSIAKVGTIPTVLNTYFSYLFYYFTNLTEVADDLFAKNPQATTFYACFYNCTSLTTLGSDVFKGCSAASDFGWLLAYSTAISSLPGDLFADCSAATSFYGSFAYCTALTKIPDGLFDNTPLVTTFYATFYCCYNNTYIPEGLLDNCPLVDSFYATFHNNRYLEGIPEKLFLYNTVATDFSYTFDACYYIPETEEITIWFGSPDITSFRAFCDDILYVNTWSVYVPADSTSYETATASVYIDNVYTF